MGDLFGCCVFRGTRVHSDDIIGVMGVDISLAYFYNTLSESEEICQKHRYSNTTAL